MSNITSTLKDEVTKNMSISTMQHGGTWKKYDGAVTNAIDCIRIQEAISGFHLEYRTWNEGRSDYYSYVNSEDKSPDAYAGSAGRAIQRVNIVVYDDNNNKVDTGIVVMYRARVDGNWLPWVSNANKASMEAVQAKYNGFASIDTNSGYAGISGKNMDGFEIRVFIEDAIPSAGGGNNNYTAGEIESQMRYLVGNTWYPLTGSAMASHIDGIEIRTNPSKSYYLVYRTHNEGRADYYDDVTSIGSDYAGSPNKPIQKLHIEVRDTNGNSLTSGVVVMYRAYVEGRWLPWVSNASAEWMQDAKNTYGLDGSLDTSSGYAGIAGKNISGVEVRIFENDAVAPGADNFNGNEVALTLSYMRDNTSNWTNFNKTATPGYLDGIRIQTDPSLPFYLSYKTQNAGMIGYYSSVLSTDTASKAYAGSPGKHIQCLSIYAFDKAGNKLVTDVVIMYRARVEGRWLPWVSNANPDWMQSVQAQYDLDGSLDTSSWYAGIAGKNIEGIEIRAYYGNSISQQPVEGLTGNEYAPALSYMYDNASNWHSFSKRIQNVNHMDGIRIQTDNSKGYYLLYRTKNSGKSDYYDFVNSTDTAAAAYAGLAGRPIQRLNIQVYRKSDNARLESGVVVMYRVVANNRWQPWVSNADDEWMVSAKAKYGLDGNLDYNSTYAGVDGYNIQGVEIRIFEESDINIPSQTPTGQSHVIGVPHICQYPEFKSGCESVSAVMALRNIGNNISVGDFVDYYLDCGSVAPNFDPNEQFGGDPRGSANSNFGCYAPVIVKALNKVLNGNTSYVVEELTDPSLEFLCSEYIDNNIPVIVWATQYMNSPRVSRRWEYNGKTIEWKIPEHCLLLVGYDDNNYIFNDPQFSSAPTFYSKEQVEIAYRGMGSQAVVIKKTSNAPTDDEIRTKKEERCLAILNALNLNATHDKLLPLSTGLFKDPDVEVLLWTTGNLQISVSAGLVAKLESDSGVETINVNRGGLNYSSEQSDLVTEFFVKLGDTSLVAPTLDSIAAEIGNGKITAGTEINANTFIFYLGVQSEINITDKDSEELAITIKFQFNNYYQDEPVEEENFDWNAFWEKVAIVSIPFGIAALAAVLSYMAPPLAPFLGAVLLA